MTIDARFEQALQSVDRLRELRKLAQHLLDEGIELQAVNSQFEVVRQALRSAGREEDEDAVLDVMDFLTGWCSPLMAIPSVPTSVKICK